MKTHDIKICTNLFTEAYPHLISMRCKKFIFQFILPSLEYYESLIMTRFTISDYAGCMKNDTSSLVKSASQFCKQKLWLSVIQSYTILVLDFSNARQNTLFSLCPCNDSRLLTIHLQSNTLGRILLCQKQILPNGIVQCSFQ